jgi:hypothetical protein
MRYRDPLETLLAYEAMIVAMEVRNQLEGFRAQHLTDEQMAELNPLVRNAVFGAMVMLHRALDENDEASQFHVGWDISQTPDYWEMPILPADVIEDLQILSRKRYAKAEIAQKCKKAFEEFRALRAQLLENYRTRRR